jgi:DNA helicase-2/ATP-dependent DNA helicase PcrA
MNAMSRAIEMAMVQAQIPHTVIGAFSFFDRKEIKDCIAMLRFISNPHDGISFHRIANKPKRALGDSTIGRIETYASQNNCSILGACFNMAFTSDGVKEGLHTIKQAFDWKWEGEPIGKILAHIIKELKYEEYLQEDPETSLERMENVQEFIILNI